MTAIGVTGHQTIPAAALQHVVDGVREVIETAASPLIALTSLAAGADQLAATEVVAAGGKLHVIVPCRAYDTSFADGVQRRRYRELLDQATDVETLTYEQPSEEAFWAAGRCVVDRANPLLAIWDGAPSRGLGGTADVVTYARGRGVPVRVVWPAGVRR